MPTIYGVVQGNVVVLPEEANLPDGTTVEIRVVTHPSEHDNDQIDREERFLRKLLEMGIITEIRRRGPIPADQDRTPIEVDGKPLSEMIIEERR